MGGGRRLLGLHDGWRGNCSGPPPHLDPHVVSAPRRGHDEPLTCFAGGLNLLLDRTEIVQCAALFGRKDLPEHAEQRVRRQRTGRQFDLTPRERAAKLVYRRGIEYHVRLLANVHDERFAIQADNRVEKRVEECHLSINFRLQGGGPLTVTTGERTGLVDADQLNQFITSGLVWLQDSLRP